jgi:hypothetical protein
VVLSGEFAFNDAHRRGRARGTQRWQVVDMSAVVGPLRETARPFGQRVREFMRAKAALEKTYPKFAEATQIQPGTPDPADAIKAAETRLGFPLPPEHVDLLRDVGAFEVDDSGIMDAGRLDRAYQQMLDDWGTPKSAMAELNAKTAALLRATTMLYTEAGDGLAALLYEPALPGRPSACGQQPAFYWIHQEYGNEPTLLTRSDGKTCRSYAEAMIWLLAQQVLYSWDDQDEGILLVDRGAPGPLHFELVHGFGPRGFADFTLQPRWNALE